MGPEEQKAGEAVVMEASRVRLYTVRSKTRNVTVHCVTIGNANPGGIVQTRVYGFDDLQTRVAYPGNSRV